MNPTKNSYNTREVYMIGFESIFTILAALLRIVRINYTVGKNGGKKMKFYKSERHYTDDARLGYEIMETEIFDLKFVYAILKDGHSFKVYEPERSFWCPRCGKPMSRAFTGNYRCVDSDCGHRASIPRAFRRGNDFYEYMRGETFKRHMPPF
jgi:predicted RNA-binding Zn-ribbon protein involved in translation (DUF1610 family)